MIRAFTKRREGPASENLVVITDTEAPSPPRVTNITCYGVNELLVEWRRPEVTFDHVSLFIFFSWKCSNSEFGFGFLRQIEFFRQTELFKIKWLMYHRYSGFRLGKNTRYFLHFPPKILPYIGLFWNMYHQIYQKIEEKFNLRSPSFNGFPSTYFCLLVFISASDSE